MERSSNATSSAAWSRAARLAPGDQVTARTLDTIGAARVRVPDRDGLTHLQFRRFASCPICNLHLRSVARRHDEIVAADIREVVVFHSTVEAMQPHQGLLPFAAIADPHQRLYAEFGVASSLRSVLHPRAWTSVLKPYAWEVAVRERLSDGGRAFSIRGDSMLGLPADFLLTPDGRIAAAKYGKHANDQWSVDEMLNISRNVPTG